MTFIDTSNGRPSSGLIAGYSILCVVSLLCTAWAINIGRSRQHYRSFFSVRILFPFALFVLALENAALAASGRLYDNLIAEGGSDFNSNLFIKAVLVLQAFEVPILLIVMFEITYLVHKKRSVNFCLMYFDEGVRVKNTAFMSFMLRNSIRALATALLALGLVTNFQLFHSGFPLDERAGTAGWWTLVNEEWDESSIHLLISLIPTAVLTVVSFYLSIMLWRYGTESAMVVHSSIMNPWFYSFFGTLALAVGQLFGTELYTVMSNAGMLVFIITILLLMAEVDKDIVKTDDIATFLVKVAEKGDRTRMSTFTQPRRDSPCRNGGEQKNDDEGCTVLADNEIKNESEVSSNAKNANMKGSATCNVGETPG